MHGYMSEEEETSINDVGKGENIRVKLADWLADKKGIPNGLVEGEVERVTEKAILLNNDWLPKSQIEKAWLI